MPINFDEKRRRKMMSRRIIWIALFMLGVSMILGRTASAQTRLGLHVTQEELNIWKQRAKSGPYKTKGDVRPNSPGDWDRILSNANSFRSNPSQERWNGYTGSGCMTGSHTGPGLERGVKLRDAAFAYLILEDTSYRDAVRNELLAQASLSGTDFGNTTKFSTASGCLGQQTGAAAMQDINAWVLHLTIGYDYIRSSLTSTQRTALDEWFLNAATFLNKRPAEVARSRWPNRDNDDYSSSPDPQGPAQNGVLYFGGPVCYQWAQAWSNLPQSQTKTAGLIGVMLNNTSLINSAKRFMKEWMRYNIYPDGSSCELDRWQTNARQRGFGYWGATISHFVIFADALARTGDTELYEYTTSDGRYASLGGPKNIFTVMTRYLQLRDHTVKRYATASASENGNATYLIDGEDSTYHAIGDVFMAPANLFFRDSYIKTHYMRTWSGAPDYPTTPPVGVSNWGGAHGALPGLLFMFGQMEGKVQPYPGKKPAGHDLPPVTNLRLIPSGK
jgi:hypothetical protein